MRDVAVIGRAGPAAAALWRTWSYPPVVVAAVAAAALLYGRGVRVLWRRGTGRGVPPWRVACFAGGLAGIVAALMSPVDAAAADLLWAHMLQHLILIVVSAPLLVLGAPLVPLALALPLRWRLSLRRLGRTPPLAVSGRVLGHPVTIWMLHVAVVFAWHVPALYDAAAESAGLHAFEHACFLGTAIAFWWLVLLPSGRRRLSAGADVLYVALAGVASGALGALFTFAGTPLYPLYATRSALIGTPPLTDQQLAGLIMWIPAGAVYMGAAAVLFALWLQGMEAQWARHPTIPVAGLGAPAASAGTGTAAAAPGRRPV